MPGFRRSPTCRSSSCARSSSLRCRGATSGSTSVAASVYVDQRGRHPPLGATTLPEALRLAPRLDVARADANQYAISARGFNNVLANKMLVLIDGRTVYTPLFSGVFWEAQDVMLEDVERIEVITGPGTALWGTNAVNGMIHVITKPAAQTAGQPRLGARRAAVRAAPRCAMADNSAGRPLPRLCQGLRPLEQRAGRAASRTRRGRRHAGRLSRRLGFGGATPSRCRATRIAPASTSSPRARRIAGANLARRAGTRASSTTRRRRCRSYCDQHHARAAAAVRRDARHPRRRRAVRLPAGSRPPAARGRRHAAVRATPRPTHRWRLRAGRQRA